VKKTIKSVIKDFLEALTDLASRLDDPLCMKRPADIPLLVPDCGWNHGEGKVAAKPAKSGDIHD
jgi:hypothetical protein